jgi:hypothetical protein
MGTEHIVDQAYKVLSNTRLVKCFYVVKRCILPPIGSDNS